MLPRLMTFHRAQTCLLILTGVTTMLMGERMGLAATLGCMRPMQQRAIGEGPVFSSLRHGEIEAQLGVSTANGTARSMSASQMSASSRSQDASFGYGAQLSDSFVFTGYLRLGSRTHEEHSTSGPTYQRSVDQSSFELVGGPTLRLGGLSVGGAASIEGLGEESQNIRTDTEQGDLTIDSVMIPTFRIFAATESMSGSQLAFGIKVYNQASTDTRIRRSGANDLETSLVRKLPSEIRLDAKTKLDEAIDLGLSFTWMTTGQASPLVDEFTLALAPEGAAMTRQLENTGRMNRDHFRIGASGRYIVDPSISFLGAAQYTAPSYAKEAYASLEADNIGGTRLDIGTETRLLGGHFHVHGGYALPRKVSLTRAAASSAQFGAEGDRVSMEQARWHFSVGGSLLY